jgi:hypothetical protein
MMSQQTTARLVAYAINNFLEQKNPGFGLLARTLPPFDIVTFCRELAPDPDQLRVALIGFNTNGNLPDYVATTVEEAVAWRNAVDIKVPLVVILNAEANFTQTKIHSLELLEPFEDTDLYREICKLGKIESRSNSLQKKVWEIVGQRRYDTLVSGQVAALYHALENQDITTALPHIGLLPDLDLGQFTDDIPKRFKANRDTVRRLLALDNNTFRSLSRALSENEKQYRRTFRQIQKFAQNPGLETLQALTLSEVIALFEAKKAPPEKPIQVSEVPPDITPAITPSKRRPFTPTPNQHFVDEILQLSSLEDEIKRKEKREQISEDARQIVDAFYEEFSEDDYGDLSDERLVRERPQSEERYSIQTNDYGEEVIFDLKPEESEDGHPLFEYMQEWVHPYRWGGRIKITNTEGLPSSTPDLFNGTVTLPFEPFKPVPHPGENDDLMDESLLGLFRKLEDRVTDTNESETSVTLFKKLHQIRSELAGHRRIFLHYPTVATSNLQLRDVIEKYIKTYEKLTYRVQQLCRRALSDYPDTVEVATARFLALDAVIIERSEFDVVVLTVLHPLHLWKWAELAKCLENNQQELNEKEQKRILESIQNLPTLLNTFLLHDKMFTDSHRHLDEHRLVFAGEINNLTSDKTVGIPYYEPVAHQSPTPDGLKQFSDQIEKFLTLYPPTRLGLVLALIDPPQLSPILKKLVTLFNQGTLFGAKVYVYRTDDSTSAYDDWQTRDSEALQLFQENPHWNLAIDLECNDYDKISKDLLLNPNKSPHIILVCDPSEAIVQPIFRTLQEETTPFGIPVQITYDSISDTIKLTPIPGGNIFDGYFGVRNALSGELQRSSMGVGNRPKKGFGDHLPTFFDYDRGTNWLAIIDRPHGTMELPHNAGRRLSWQSTNSRTLAIHTNERDWQEYWLEQLNIILPYFNLSPLATPNYILKRLLELFPVLPDGLISIISTSSSQEKEEIRLGKAFDQSALARLLGVMVTLHWYRRHQTGTVLVSIDGVDFADWYGDADPAKETKSTYHFVALWLKQDKLYADILTLHTHETTFEDLPALHKAEKDFKPLEIFARSLETLFEQDNNQTILTPLRRALLRERISIAVFAAPKADESDLLGQSKESKTQWANVINNLFTHYRPQIRLLDVRVALKEHLQSHNEEAYRGDDSDLLNYQKVIVRLPGSFLQPISVTTPSKPGMESIKEDTTDIQIQEIGDLSNDQTKLPVQSKERQEKFIQPQTVPVDEDEIKSQAEQLRRVLIAYGIAIASIDIEKTQTGPRFIRYWVKLQPPAGRLSEMQRYAVDIARELGSRTVPFIDNIPGERFVGVDLARDNPETIMLAPVLDELPSEQPNQLFIALGQSPSGEDVKLDVARLPHMLVAGSTGSGKTVFLSSLVTSLVWRHTKDELEILLVDPKQTDFGVFEDLGHLRHQRIFYEPEDAIDVLRELTTREKEQRTKLLRKARCPNILEYNRRNPPKRLPWIVVVIDEFADIILTLQRKERDLFERQISRLAATGRNVGIHLVIATQRPTTDVITGTIKANIPARVSFRLPSVIDSRTILDQPGAENLLGQGDMLVSFSGEVQRLQGYYASYDEILQILEEIK